MDMNLLAHQLFPLHERALKLLEAERQERQAAQESARRAEHQLLGLQYAVQSYQRALTENAESIAEHESLRQVALNQAREATQEREQIQAERETMLETLKLAHERISWLEKRLHRLPRWVRRWMDVG
jgi:chromosome segregation ATPase